MTETLTDLCKRLEHFETPSWAAEAILKKEILTQRVVDPCCGTGVLSDAASQAGYTPLSIDIQDWGYTVTHQADFLEYQRRLDDQTVFMNPPFSKVVQFVEKAFELGARKIVCFQRFAWWESKGRRDFWQVYPRTGFTSAQIGPIAGGMIFRLISVVAVHRQLMRGLSGSVVSLAERCYRILVSLV